MITQAQFGYHISTYVYTQYLQHEYDITYCCMDYNKTRISVEGVRVIYSSRQGNIIKRNWRFRYQIIQLVKTGFDYVFIMHFVGVSLLHLFSKRSKLICDVRTGATTDKVWLRTLLDNILRVETRTFKNRTIISKSLAEKFGIKKYHLLPLGANAIPFDQKDFDAFHLVYLGEFDNRRIEDTIRGFHIFYQQHKDHLKCKYTIIGAGDGKERIEAAVKECGLEDIVEFTGYIHYSKVAPYLQQGNIGISYVPITTYFDCQPPTKTFEYLLSGMAVLATSTKENQLVITKENGVLIKDNVNEVANGLEQLYKNRMRYDAKKIQEDAQQYHWEHIVNANLSNYLLSL